jgi:hypothetical protein
MKQATVGTSACQKTAAQSELKPVQMMFRLTQLKYETVLLFRLFICNLIINAARNSQYTALRDCMMY